MSYYSQMILVSLHFVEYLSIINLFYPAAPFCPERGIVRDGTQYSWFLCDYT